MNIYVGNLSYDITEDDLKQAFEGFGQVKSTAIIMDKLTGKSRGFGFVEMPIEDEAKKAIADMNDKELKGRTLNVNEASPKSESSRGRRSGGGGYGGGGGQRDDRSGGGGYGGGGQRDNRSGGGGQRDNRRSKRDDKRGRGSSGRY